MMEMHGAFGRSSAWPGAIGKASRIASACSVSKILKQGISPRMILAKMLFVSYDSIVPSEALWSSSSEESATRRIHPTQKIRNLPFVPKLPSADTHQTKYNPLAQRVHM